jgi:hypothetical protein
MKSAFSPEVVRSSRPDSNQTSTKRGGKGEGRYSTLNRHTQKKLILEKLQKQLFYAKQKSTGKLKRNKAHRVKKIFCEEGSTSEGEEWFSLVCSDNYRRSRHNDQWVQCIKCKEWAHLLCTKGRLHYK